MSRYVYVAGPLSGDFEGNCAKALEAATALRQAGLWPYIPHLSIHWHALHPQPYEAWMALDFAWIGKCDALYRMPGESRGADREVELAMDLEIPVFLSLTELLAWAREDA